MPNEDHIDPTNQRIMESAQRLIQLCGYNGFSYRDIGAEVGIRSASIHYHFPTKADLGKAVAERYTRRFIDRLSAAEAEGIDAYALLERYASLFREALVQDGRMCLCGILGAEISSLPAEVAGEARRFIEANTEWLLNVIEPATQRGEIETPGSPDAEARLLFASLEGALIYSKAIGPIQTFDEISQTALMRFRRP
jgi:TetR/AcrR family transcriptional repressor of nem operon